MTQVPLYFRSDAKAQFEDLIAKSDLFRKNVGSLHHLITCYAVRLYQQDQYHSRTEVHNESIKTCDQKITVSVDFRVEDGPSVIIESYFINKL